MTVRGELMHLHALKTSRANAGAYLTLQAGHRESRNSQRSLLEARAQQLCTSARFQPEGLEEEREATCECVAPSGLEGSYLRRGWGDEPCILGSSGGLKHLHLVELRDQIPELRHEPLVLPALGEQLALELDLHLADLGRHAGGDDLALESWRHATLAKLHLEPLLAHLQLRLEILLLRVGFRQLLRQQLLLPRPPRGLLLELLVLVALGQDALHEAIPLRCHVLDVLGEVPCLALQGCHLALQLDLLALLEEDVLLQLPLLVVGLGHLVGQPADLLGYHGAHLQALLHSLLRRRLLRLQLAVLNPACLQLGLQASVLALQGRDPILQQGNSVVARRYLIQQVLLVLPSLHHLLRQLRHLANDYLALALEVRDLP
mmetsp:Transcript_117463/g.314931  ORF Transcript_117463/g.314931 Transcript_117463/m.314931 type:complete len:375 (-) Transcript_117463:559-1683(-)